MLDFSEKLIELVNNEQLRMLYESNGWDHVRDKFHYTRLVSDMEKLYYKLLNQQN